MILKLPYPPSANRYYRTYMPKGFKAPVTALSDEAKIFKRCVQGEARLAGIREALKGHIGLTITLQPHRPLDWAKRAANDPDGWRDGVRCLDLDNCLKVVIDSLKGVAFVDDKQVKRIHAEIGDPIPQGQIIISIEEIVERTLLLPVSRGA